MKPKRITKPSDDVVKLFAGVILATSSIVGIVITFLNIVDLSLTRKILVGFIAFLVWMLIEFFAWGVGKAPDKRKTSWSLLLNLIVAVHNEANSDSKRIFQKELLIRISRWALISLIAVIIVAGVYKALEKWAGPFIEPPEPTFTPTQTLTLTPSPTITLTPTRVPEAASLYYLFILDASARMTASFKGSETKWLAIHTSARNRLIEDLTERAHFGLIVLGGNLSNSTKTCDMDTQMAIPIAFDNQQRVLDTIDSLQPEGVAALGSAINLARDELLALPNDVHKELFFFLGGGNDCAPDKWRRVLNFIKFYESSLSGVHTELVILPDETINPKVITDLQAEVTKLGLEKQVGVNAPANNQELQVVIVNIYNQSVVRARPFEPTAVSVQETVNAINTAPPIAPQTPAPPGATQTQITATTTPTFTVVIQPTPTLIPPTPIPPTPIPPSSTSAPIPPPPSTPTPFVELLSYNYLQTGIGCQVDVTVRVSGSAATGSFHAWNASYGPEGDIYPPTTLQVSTYNNNLVTLGGLIPEFYWHEVWFEYNGTSSNRLIGLICPGLTPSP